MEPLRLVKKRSWKKFRYLICRKKAHLHISMASPQDSLLIIRNVPTKLEFPLASCHIHYMFEHRNSLRIFSRKKSVMLTQSASMYSFVANLMLLIDNETCMRMNRDEKCKWTVSLALHFVRWTAAAAAAFQQRCRKLVLYFSFGKRAYVYTARTFTWQSVLNPHFEDAVHARHAQLNA